MKLLRDHYFSIAKLTGKLVCKEKKEELNNIMESMKYYKKIKEGIQQIKNPTESEMEMLKICSEMCELLPIHAKGDINKE